jgi:protein-S-isoprenylcysteine O-methyltransferase Ste14
MSAPSTDHAEVVVLPPVLHAGAIVLGSVAKHWLGGTVLPDRNLRLGLGVALLVLGFTGTALFVRSFRRTGQEPSPHTPTPALSFDGLFRFTRNPVYISLACVQAGLGIVRDDPWTVGLLVPVMVVMHYGVVLREEAYLEAKFGEEYLAYKRRVRRWLW